MPESDFVFQMVAVVAVALGGSLLGVAGGKGGDLARRGEHPRWIDTLFGIVVALGGLAILLGLIAGGQGQPPSVWLWLVGLGGGLIALTWGCRRHLAVLRAQSPGARIITPEKPHKSE